MRRYSQIRPTTQTLPILISGYLDSDFLREDNPPRANAAPNGEGRTPEASASRRPRRCPSCLIIDPDRSNVSGELTAPPTPP